MQEINTDPSKEKIVIEIDETGQAPPQSFSSNPETQYPTLGVLPNILPKALRRKRASKNAGLINFYDLGLMKPEGGNSYQDRDLSVFLTLEQSKDFEALNAAADYIEAQAKPKINAPLNISLAAWKTRFKKLQRAELKKYNFALLTEGEANYLNAAPINDDNPNITDAGLKFDKIDKLIIIPDFITPPPFYFYVLGGLFENILYPEDVKITKEPDYAATSASLNLTPKQGAVDIYLNPAFFFTDASKYTNLGFDITETVGSPGGAGYFVYFFDALLCASTQKFPAAPVTTVSTSKESMKHLNYFVTSWRRSQALRDDATQTVEPGGGDIVKIYNEEMRLHPQARAVDSQKTDINTSIRYIPTSTAPFFPIYASYKCGVPDNTNSATVVDTETAIAPGAFPVNNDSTATERTYRIKGGLIAAINQKNDWFFLWSDKRGIQ